MAGKMDNQVFVTAEMHLEFTAEDIWPLLCPVREYDWVDGWECELVFSESGYNELGCVFKTDFPSEGGEDTWLTSRFDLLERIEFVRMNAIRAIHYIITLTPDRQGTLLTWTQHVSALSEDGKQYVKDKPVLYKRVMGRLEKQLVHYLNTGEMLKDGS